MRKIVLNFFLSGSKVNRQFFHGPFASELTSGQWESLSRKNRTSAFSANSTNIFFRDIVPYSLVDCPAFDGIPLLSQKPGPMNDHCPVPKLSCIQRYDF